jgi:hypothetical protein
MPSGVDALQNKELIQKLFSTYDLEVASLIHIRRGGDISGQQLGMHMLESLREAGATRLIANVQNVESDGDGFTVEVVDEHGKQ